MGLDKRMESRIAGLPLSRQEKKASVRNAQGIEAVSFFAAGKKDTSGKPGRRGAAMRPKEAYAHSRALITGKLFAAVLVLACSGCAPGKLLIMEGNFHASRGRYAQAIESYSRSLAFPEAVPYGEFGLGTVYMALDEEAGALVRFEKAREALEDNPRAKELLFRIVYNTGIIHFEAGDYENAAGEFRNALKYDSGRIEAKRNLELSLLSLARNGAAPQDASLTVKFEDSGNDTVLFEYIRQKEREQWKSRENREDEIPSGMDY